MAKYNYYPAGRGRERGPHHLALQGGRGRSKAKELVYKAHLHPLLLWGRGGGEMERSQMFAVGRKKKTSSSFAHTQEKKKRKKGRFAGGGDDVGKRRPPHLYQSRRGRKKMRQPRPKSWNGPAGGEKKKNPMFVPRPIPGRKSWPR